MGAEANTAHGEPMPDCERDAHSLERLFEPGGSLFFGTSENRTLTEAATVSIAISMKRIADELGGRSDRFGLIDSLFEINMRRGQ